MHDLRQIHRLPRRPVAAPGGGRKHHAVEFCGRRRKTGGRYIDIARRVGRPGGARAVGMANRRNPIAIIIPCHRVIGADGSLTGYGGGIKNKRMLLEHEQN